MTTKDLQQIGKLLDEKFVVLKEELDEKFVVLKEELDGRFVEFREELDEKFVLIRKEFETKIDEAVVIIIQTVEKYKADKEEVEALKKRVEKIEEGFQTS